MRKGSEQVTLDALSAKMKNILHFKCLEFFLHKLSCHLDSSSWCFFLPFSFLNPPPSPPFRFLGNDLSSWIGRKRIVHIGSGDAIVMVEHTRFSEPHPPIPPIYLFFSLLYGYPAIFRLNKPRICLKENALASTSTSALSSSHNRVPKMITSLVDIFLMDLIIGLFPPKIDFMRGRRAAIDFAWKLSRADKANSHLAKSMDVKPSPPWEKKL